MGASLLALAKSIYKYWQFPTSQQLRLHSPIDGNIGRKQIAPFIFEFWHEVFS